jgi:lysophospholipase L1-like esterase
MINNQTQKNMLSIGLGLLLMFILFLTLGSLSDPILINLKKAASPFFKDPNLATEEIADTSSIYDTLTNPITSERVMLIGDSQLEGLQKPVYKYCKLNNHELVSTILWYGSTTKIWSESSDTLDYFINKYKPTFIFIAIGLNELFIPDKENLKANVKNIISVVKKNKLKYFWIGPAAWSEDKGITQVLSEANGKFFYPSHKLELDRANDNMHPTRAAAEIWFDSVAVAVTKLKRYGLDLSIKKDTTVKVSETPLVVLTQKRS